MQQFLQYKVRKGKVHIKFNYGGCSITFFFRKIFFNAFNILHKPPETLFKKKSKINRLNFKTQKKKKNSVTLSRIANHVEY